VIGQSGHHTTSVRAATFALGLTRFDSH
jgi:hypothetical protein